MMNDSSLVTSEPLVFTAECNDHAHLDGENLGNGKIRSAQACWRIDPLNRARAAQIERAELLQNQAALAATEASRMRSGEVKTAEKKLSEVIRQREVLFQFVERRHRLRSLAEIYDAALDAMLSALGCQRASILLYDHSGELRFVGWRALSEDYRRALESHAPWKTDDPDPQPVCFPEIATAEFQPSLKEVILREGIGALAFVPLVVQGKLAGKCVFYYNAPHAFADEDVELSLSIARQLALGIERLRAEQAVQQSQKAEKARRVELETLMEAVPAVVWIAHDPECRCIIGNRVGYEFLRLPVGANLSKTALGDERPGSFEFFKKGWPVPDAELPMQAAARSGRAIRDQELEVRFADGARRWIFGSVVPLHNETGSVRGVIATFVDITDKKRAEEKLERTVAERTVQLRDTVAELEAFSYSVAHDMRAPLRAMTTFSRFLEEDFAEVLPDEGKSYVRRIAGSAERLDRLIQDVLDYSKISRGEMPLETVDVEKLTRDIIEIYPHFQLANATMLIQSPMPCVAGNPAGLTQCISNLLSNAVKFVPPGRKPQIRIWAETTGEWARFWFEDNGLGISKEGQKRIFHMFQRLNPTSEFEGAGIGLTIVRKAAERMGGRAGVESSAGVGSRFWLELKRAD